MDLNGIAWLSLGVDFFSQIEACYRLVCAMLTLEIVNQYKKCCALYKLYIGHG